MYHNISNNFKMLRLIIILNILNNILIHAKKKKLT